MARYWRTTLGAAMLAGSLLLGAPATQALPPGGANTSNTAGTESTISPLTLQAGDTISFTVKGFPAHEQVYIKVDDGAACPSDSAQGACVVHQQKTDAQGRASGSFVLSKELAEGQHTLRFLATEIMKDDKGTQIGTQGYSNQSPVFSITGVNENSSGGITNKNVDPETINKSTAAGTQNQSGNTAAEEQPEETATDTGKATTATSGTEAAVQEEITYLDANGQKISKEEYELLMASGTPASSISATPLPSRTTAVASASANETKTGNTEQTEAKEAHTETKPSAEIPWIGLAGLGIAGAVSVFIVLGRRRS